MSIPDATEPRRRLAIVGPVVPFRSGIAQHTTLLAQALHDRAEVLVVSFRHLYPSWLFPGRSDRDERVSSLLAPPSVQYAIDLLNPWTWRRAAAMLDSFQPDMLIVPWWTFLCAPCFGYLTRKARRSGTSVRFLCHNVVDHEAAWWKLRLTRTVLATANSFVTHTSSDSSRLREMFPASPVVVHPHPVYGHFPPASEVLPRRAGLELLFFGIVRPYKGLDVLIEALAHLGETSVHLTVVGEFWAGRKEIERRIRELRLTERVELVPRYVSEEEAANYFARADVVVLPYRAATGSGVIGLAYHYEKPVIVARVGGLPDVVVEEETGFVVPPESPVALAGLLARLSAEGLRSMGNAIRRHAAGLSWDSLAEAVLRPIEAEEAGEP